MTVVTCPRAEIQPGSAYGTLIRGRFLWASHGGSGRPGRRDHLSRLRILASLSRKIQVRPDDHGFRVSFSTLRPCRAAKAAVLRGGKTVCGRLCVHSVRSPLSGTLPLVTSAQCPSTGKLLPILGLVLPITVSITRMLPRGKSTTDDGGLNLQNLELGDQHPLPITTCASTATAIPHELS